MKRFAQIFVAGLFACSGFASEPGAQEQSVQDVPAVANQPAGEVIPFSEEPTLLYATELMQRAEIYAEAIAEVTEVPDVDILEVSELPRVEADQEIFEDTMERFMSYYREEFVLLREAMAENPVVADALENAGAEVSNVLAAEIRPDLGLRVYVRDW